MAKDPRYEHMKRLIEAGAITEFKELFVSFPRGQFAKDLGKNYTRINNCIDNTDKFTYEEAEDICKLIEVDYEKIAKLIRTQYLNKRKKNT